MTDTLTQVKFINIDTAVYTPFEDESLELTRLQLAGIAKFVLFENDIAYRIYAEDRELPYENVDITYIQFAKLLDTFRQYLLNAHTCTCEYKLCMYTTLTTMMLLIRDESICVYNACDGYKHYKAEQLQAAISVLTGAYSKDSAAIHKILTAIAITTVIFLVAVAPALLILTK